MRTQQLHEGEVAPAKVEGRAAGPHLVAHVRTGIKQQVRSLDVAAPARQHERRRAVPEGLAGRGAAREKQAHAFDLAAMKSQKEGALVVGPILNKVDGSACIEQRAHALGVASSGRARESGPAMRVGAVGHRSGAKQLAHAIGVSKGARVHESGLAMRVDAVSHRSGAEQLAHAAGVAQVYRELEGSLAIHAERVGRGARAEQLAHAAGMAPKAGELQRGNPVRIALVRAGATGQERAHAVDVPAVAGNRQLSNALAAAASRKSSEKKLGGKMDRREPEAVDAATS